MHMTSIKKSMGATTVKQARRGPPEGGVQRPVVPRPGDQGEGRADGRALEIDRRPRGHRLLDEGVLQLRRRVCVRSTESVRIKGDKGVEISVSYYFKLRLVWTFVTMFFVQEKGDRKGTHGWRLR